MVRRWHCALGIALAFGSMLVAPLSARALGTTHFNVYPTAYDKNVPTSRSWFVYHLDRSQTNTGSLTIVSTAQTPITVELYPVDATTTSDGSFALLGKDDPRKDVGSWVSLSQSQVVLAPGQTVAVPFRLTIPDNASVGDHLGGIAVQENVPTSTQVVNGAAVNVVSRVGMRIYETVPGRQQADLSVTHFGDGAASNSDKVFTLTLKNNGNVTLHPQAKVSLNSIWKKNSQTISFNNLGSIAPSRSATYQLPVSREYMIAGYLTANIKVAYGPGHTASQAFSYFVYKWWMVAIPVGVLFAATLIFQIKKRFTISRRPKQTEANKP